MCDSPAPVDTHSLQQRVERLQELTDFTQNCKKQLDHIFQQLGWSQQYRESSQEAMEQCPFDPGHRVPARSLERHKASCRLSRMGYSAEEQAEMCDPSVCYENSSVTRFTMDKDTQHRMILQARSAAPLMRMEGVFWQGQYSGQPVDVPQSHKRALCDLTVADRLALYDQVIAATARQREQSEDLYVDLVAKLKKGDEQNEPKSHLELMAEMRDYKRRRQSYRAKNVHITKKSYTEVIREVIHVHSGELARQWREEEEERRAECSSHRGRSLSSESQHSQGRRGRRSPSSESQHSHGRRHRSRERSRERESKKKKRKRDSRSPDERRHDRKKKKKKEKKEKKIPWVVKTQECH